MRLFWMDIDMEMVDIMVAMLRRISEGFPTQETFLSFLMRLQWGNDNLLITLHFGWSNYYCLIIYKQNVHGFLGPMFVGRPLPIFHGDSLWCKNIMLNSIPSNIIIDNWTLKHWANNLFKVNPSVNYVIYIDTERQPFAHHSVRNQLSSTSVCMFSGG